MIVDAQIHLWAADRLDRPWPGGRSHPHRPGSFLTEDALKEMDAAGVDRAVIVPPSWEGDRNDLALDAARTHPDRFAIMGRFAIERPEDQAVLAGWKRQPGMLGLRFTFGSPSQRGWLTDGTADWFWPVAERLQLYSSQPYPYRNLHDPIHRAFDTFGPRRVFWARTSRDCPARIARPSRSSPRNCRGSVATIWSS